MAESMWAGLVTNASPYAVPPGAAVEQVNLTTVTPGQLTSRGGMRPVAFAVPNVTPTTFADATQEMRDCYPYVFGNAVKVLALNASGEVVVRDTPAFGTAMTPPSEPSLTPSNGQVQSNYVGSFYDFAGEPPT